MRGKEEKQVNNFKEDLIELLGKHRIGVLLDTPNGITAEYLCDCVKSMFKMVNERRNWCGGK